MYETVLWATDGSPLADGALRVALELLEPGGRLIAFHCDERFLGGRRVGAARVRRRGRPARQAHPPGRRAQTRRHRRTAADRDDPSQHGWGDRPECRGLQRRCHRLRLEGIRRRSRRRRRQCRDAATSCRILPGRGRVREGYEAGCGRAGVADAWAPRVGAAPRALDAACAGTRRGDASPRNPVAAHRPARGLSPMRGPHAGGTVEP